MRERHKSAVCLECGRGPEEAGRISQRGLCTDCGVELMTEANRQMRDRKGPMYEAWRRSMQAHARRL